MCYEVLISELCRQEGQNNYNEPRTFWVRDAQIFKPRRQTDLVLFIPYQGWLPSSYAAATASPGAVTDVPFVERRYESSALSTRRRSNRIIYKITNKPERFLEPVPKGAWWVEELDCVGRTYSLKVASFFKQC